MELQHFLWLLLAVSTGGVAFAYVGYPFFIFLMAKCFGRSHTPGQILDPDLPSVTLLIAAHNEGRIIRQRIENALALDYPSDLLTIAICSDGSSDDTNEVVAALVNEHPGRIQLFAYSDNRGKTTVLNETVPRLRSELIVLSDANTVMRQDAVRRLASWFRQPEVGAVCGRLVLIDPVSGSNVDSLYWKYETFLKKCESRLGALLGSNGAIYAIRRNLFPQVPPNTIIEDFYIPLEAKRRSGCRIVYDTRAVASEETPSSISAEFRRRARIGAGGFQAIGLLWPLLSPAHGWIAFAFLCHKVLRWVCPFLLVLMLLSNALLLGSAEGQALMACQLAGYGLAAAGPWIPRTPKAFKILRLPAMFVSMNLALLVGFFKWLFFHQSGGWSRTERTEQDCLLFGPPANQKPVIGSTGLYFA